ncbi:putative alpha,alpha-trehalose-phosphate synthase [UDP-forming] 9 [Asimina triloba]
MVSRSCLNLFDLVSEELLDIPKTPRMLPRVMTVPGIIPDIEDNDAIDGNSDAFSSGTCKQIIVVANQLPLLAQKDSATGGWSFSLDEDSLLLQMKDGLSSGTEVIYVGSLKVDIEAKKQEEVAQKLLEEFHCIPTFLDPDLQRKFYHGFCKKQLWPLFHYMLPISPDHGDRFDKSLWQAYKTANRRFAEKVFEVINPDNDYVWIHDYHLMALPTLLRKRAPRVKLGFFLHSPFPTSEIYRTLPVRDEILRSLLNSDLIGFHTFDYARHFLSCCSRLLGVDYESKRGHIGLEYYGRTVYIKILPVGVHMGRLETVLNLPCTVDKVKDIQEQFKGRKIILGVDDMDIFKGISLKLLAMEQLLKQYLPKIDGKVVLVQIANPARSEGKDVQEARQEALETVERINRIYGSPGYAPVVLIDQLIPLYEKIAYYAAADCCIVNAVRDGMNLVPYKYVVCRQGTPQMNKALGINEDSPCTSMLVVSEFIGCSPSLSGAIRVNPWNVEDVADSLYKALSMAEPEKQLRHEKHYRYVSSHNVAYWAHSFEQDLERACKDHYNKRCWGIGWGLGFRVVALSPSFRKLSIEHIVSAYKNTSRRAIFLDYDGTVMPQSSISKNPSTQVISVLNRLCSDPKNTVFIISGRGRTSLSDWWGKADDWEACSVAADLDWKTIVEPVMKLYTETTDGSCIESKESALVWHHQDADPDFGSCQAKELLDHLENVLANEPVTVKRGQHIVEVKPQGISKGWAAEKLLSTMVANGKPPDFVLCIGDDRSDEDMFESILSTVSNPSSEAAPEIFACTVGQKPSKAKYYLDDTVAVMKLLQGLGSASSQQPKRSEGQVSFESTA